MFPTVTEFMNYGQQTIRAARYIGQSFMITLSHVNRLPVTIQYPYEKLIDHPKDAFGIQGSRTDHRTLFNKRNALAVRSPVGQ